MRIVIEKEEKWRPLGPSAKLSFFLSISSIIDEIEKEMKKVKAERSGIGWWLVWVAELLWVMGGAPRQCSATKKATQPNKPTQRKGMNKDNSTWMAVSKKLMKLIDWWWNELSCVCEWSTKQPRCAASQRKNQSTLHCDDWVDDCFLRRRGGPEANY